MSLPSFSVPDSNLWVAHDAHSNNRSLSYTHPSSPSSPSIPLFLSLSLSLFHGPRDCSSLLVLQEMNTKRGEEKLSSFPLLIFYWILHWIISIICCQYWCCCEKRRSSLVSPPARSVFCSQLHVFVKVSLGLTKSESNSQKESSHKRDDVENDETAFPESRGTVTLLKNSYFEPTKSVHVQYFLVVSSPLTSAVHFMMAFV